jgi:hypothetical protein
MELFPDTTPMPAGHDPRICPQCGAAPLARVADCEIVHWLCQSCGHCWQETRRNLRAVDPITCPGCSTKPRPECIALFAREFPRVTG